MYEVVESLHPDFEAISSQLSEKYAGRNLNGLDVDRVHDYFNTNDLAIKPYIVVGPEDLETVNAIDTSGSLRHMLNPKTDGIYSPELSMSVILRNPKSEELNGPIYTEGLMVHELAHATAGIRQYLRVKGTNGYQVARTGYVVQQMKLSGAFIEEGWADYNRVNYLRMHLDANTINPIASALRMPNDLNALLNLYLGGRPIAIPMSYIKLSEAGRPIISDCALPGLAMDILTKTKPRILTALHAGRSTIHGLRALATEIDNVSPGLYHDLRQLQYNQEDFTRGLHMVMDRATN